MLLSGFNLVIGIMGTAAVLAYAGSVQDRTCQLLVMGTGWVHVALPPLTAELLAIERFGVKRLFSSDMYPFMSSP